MAKVPAGIIEKLRGVKERITSETGGSGIKYYKSRDGKSTIRILPGLGDNPDLFFRERGVHWHVGPNDDRVVCPNLTDDAGLPCAVCEAIAVLSKGTDEDKAMAREMRVRREYMFNIIDRENMSAGVQVWTAPPSVMGIIATFVEDPDYGAIWDPVDGTDFIVSRQKKGRIYDYSDSYLKRKSSMLAEDEKSIMALLEEAVNLHEIQGMVPTYDQTHRTLFGEKDEEAVGETASEPEEEPEAKPVPEPKEEPKAKPVPEPKEEPKNTEGDDLANTIRERLSSLRKGK